MRVERPESRDEFRRAPLGDASRQKSLAQRLVRGHPAVPVAAAAVEGARRLQFSVFGLHGDRHQRSMQTLALRLHDVCVRDDVAVIPYRLGPGPRWLTKGQHQEGRESCGNWERALHFAGPLNRYALKSATTMATASDTAANPPAPMIKNSRAAYKNAMTIA